MQQIIGDDAALPVRLIDGSLADPARAIGGPRFDMIFFWGAPAAALLFVWGWIAVALLLPPHAGETAVLALTAGVSILTFAHLIAVVPRAYLNRQVFSAHRARLVVAPLLLVAALLVSPTLLLCAAVLAVFWDVHHSAMQTFGLARIYDMKAGNDAAVLRTTDLRLNWVLYVGPIAAGASLIPHFAHFDRFAATDWRTLATLPGIVSTEAWAIRELAILAWIVAIGWAAIDYARAARAGYRLPVHKAVLIAVTGLVSIAAWGLAPPFAAFAIINLFHAVQYFAIVWLKEGGRIRARVPALSAAAALAGFVALCTGFGIVYYLLRDATVLIAPFIACSLLHFWYDGFVWSVTRKQV